MIILKDRDGNVLTEKDNVTCPRAPAPPSVKVTLKDNKTPEKRTDAPSINVVIKDNK